MHALMMRVWKLTLIAAVVSWLGSAGLALAADWPMWRYDAGRSAASPEGVPDDLSLHWMRQLPAPRPAWPASQGKLQFDDTYHPVVAAGSVFVGSNVNDTVTAYDLKTGDELWRFYAEGPVRFAPVVHDGRVYFTSDDGRLYCLAAATGQTIWQAEGGPSRRYILGNDRLVSAWPARTGAVVVDNQVYFTASIWPFMGIFIHGADAATGRILWTNSQTGSDWVVQPHNSPAFGSIVPTGYLAAAGNLLVVPGGRSLPAVFDRHTGKLDHFQFGGKTSGDWFAVANQAIYVVGTEVFTLAGGKKIGSQRIDVLGSELLLEADDDTLTAYQVAESVKQKTSLDRKGVEVTTTTFSPREAWSADTADGAEVTIYAQAGDQLFTAVKNRICRFDLEHIKDKDEIEPAWEGTVEGNVTEVVPAADHVLVVTDSARLYSFGSGKQALKQHKLAPQRPAAAKDVWKTRAAEAIRKSGRNGYAVALGIGSGRWIEELIQQSSLHVIAIDPDAAAVEAFRKRMDAAGWYGVRVSAHVGRPAEFELPPYLANLLISEDPQAAGLTDASTLARAFEVLRPYGGVACLPSAIEQHTAWTTQAAALPQAAVERAGELTFLRRPGRLPAAGSWTHQYGDAANSVVSQDARVKAPLGLLWFGGPSNDKILPRHGHGPSPQVAGGRLIIEGRDTLRAVDVYTGRLLWEKELPNLGEYYDTTKHFAGAGEIGSNYVTLADRIYVAFRDKLLELEAETGKTLRTYQLEAQPDEPAPVWGFIAATDDLLLATSSPIKPPVVKAASDKDAKDAKPADSKATDAKPADTKAKAAKDDDDDDDDDDPKSAKAPAKAPEPAAATPEPAETDAEPPLFEAARHAPASRRLVVYDRRTGKELWSRTAAFSFRHNCIVAGGGKVYLIDGLTPARLSELARRGIKPEEKSRLWALDERTGREVWSTEQDVFGTFLNYSVEHDVLLQAGSANRDRAADESGKGIVAYQGRDGQVLWKDLELTYGGPVLLWRDKIITNTAYPKSTATSALAKTVESTLAKAIPKPSTGFQLELLTGKQTGWSFTRMYGCNTVIGAQNLLTFRSAAAGFCDLSGDSGTGNLGGFRSSCTSNLIVADGVLSAPDYTRTCTCAYQNQCSLALIHMPEAELWTFNTFERQPDRIGVNFGAPGDRRASGGTLWTDYPSVGGKSPEVAVKVEGVKVRYLRGHTGHFKATDNEALPWVAASAVVGARRIEISTGFKQPKKCTVRLHVAEPDEVAAGERVFDVQIDGQTVLEKVDPVAAGRRTAQVFTLPAINVGATLVLELKPHAGETILGGVEIVAQP